MEQDIKIDTIRGMLYYKWQFLIFKRGTSMEPLNPEKFKLGEAFITQFFEDKEKLKQNVEEGQRKLLYLRSLHINPLVSAYVQSNLINCLVSTKGLEQRFPIELLSRKGFLDGDCWQSSTFASIFLGKQAKVHRGHLTLYPGNKYAHGWVNFVMFGKQYVYDPALGLLIDAKSYNETYEANSVAEVKGGQINDELVELIKASKEPKIYIPGLGNLGDPFFRTNSIVSAKISGNKVKQLKANFLNGE